MNLTPHRAQRLFACLGDPSRFRVVTTLLAGEHCVTDLARRIGLSQSCTTRHLQALQKEGLVVGARTGKRVVFRLNTDDSTVAGLVAWVAQRPRGDGASEPERPARDPDSVRTQSYEQARVAKVTRPGLDSSDCRPVAGAARGRDLEDFLL